MAKFTEVVDFPTPPLPDPTAINRLTFDSITFSTVLSVFTLSVVLLCLLSCAVTTTVALVTPSILKIFCCASFLIGSIDAPL